MRNSICIAILIAAIGCGGSNPTSSPSGDEGQNNTTLVNRWNSETSNAQISAFEFRVDGTFAMEWASGESADTGRYWAKGNYVGLRILTEDETDFIRISMNGNKLTVERLNHETLRSVLGRDNIGIISEGEIPSELGKLSAANFPSTGVRDRTVYVGQ